MKSYIYALVDPLTLRVRYVGQTNQTPKQRWRGHLNDAQSRNSKPLHAWINSLWPKHPLIVVLDVVEKKYVPAWPDGNGATESTVNAAEMKWMKRFERSGLLFNVINRTCRVYRRLVNPTPEDTSVNRS